MKTIYIYFTSVVPNFSVLYMNVLAFPADDSVDFSEPEALTLPRINPLQTGSCNLMFLTMSTFQLFYRLVLSNLY